jgi:hypothetical protein
VSGGTIESGVNMFKQDNKLLKDMAHPYYLVPESAGKPLDQLPDKGIAPYPVKSAAAKGWYAKLYCPTYVCMCLAHSCAVEHAAAELALPSRAPCPGCMCAVVPLCLLCTRRPA